MSGFVAIVADPGEATVPESDLRGLAKAYRSVRGGDSESVDAGDRIRACVFAREGETGPTIKRRGDSWAFSAGRLNRTPTLIDADLDRAEGQFAFVRYDAENRTSTIASDPFGMLGLFTARRDGRTYLATSALALARHLRLAPSRVGMETFLLTGYQCGNETGWETLDRVPAGTRIDVSPTAHRRTRYWRPRLDRALTRQGMEASLELCIASASDAVRTAGAGRGTVWCDLTGGYDTRFLALLASAAEVPFIASTSGDGNQEDVALARRIAASAGWEWILLVRPENWDEALAGRIPEAIGWGDGALDALQLSGVLWNHERKAHRGRAILNGGGGEHYWSYAWQHEYGRSSRHGRADLDTWVRIRMVRDPGSMRVFARDPTGEVLADLRRRMEPVIEPYLDEPRSAQTDILYLHKCTGHFGAYASAAMAHVDVVLPFYTRESFTAAFSTNPHHRFGHRFYRRLIDHLDPGIAALPTTKGGPAQPLRLSNFRAFAPYYARLGERGVNKVVHRCLGRSLRSPAGLADDHAARIRAAAVRYVGTNVETWCSLPLYRRAELAELLENAGRPDFRESVMLGRILTTELSLRAARARVD